MKKRRYLTEVKGETDYYYDDTPKSNFTENRGEFGVGQLSDHNNPKSFREIDSSNYHIQEKYHKIKINKKDHEYLKGYKKN